MNHTPNANRTHIAIFGKQNAGKSSLFNAMINQDISVISPVKGTTTDPVSKAMELLPYGPVVWLDTAGLDDEGPLGNLRVKKTMQIINHTDFALYVLDSSSPDLTSYKQLINTFKEHHIPHLLVCNKTDLISHESLSNLQANLSDAVFVSTRDIKTILDLKAILIKKLQKNEEEKPLLGDLLPYGSSVILVVPIDSEAPKRRLILPQVQVLRDCLDNGFKSYVVRDTELENALYDLPHTNLVITDSQVFKQVSQIVPDTIFLTSFSILYARYKGELNTFLDGISAIDTLNETSKILICENCSHNHSHEDIGRVKIPKLLCQHTRCNLNFDFRMGHDFPIAEEITSYDLIIHCGACMVTPKTMHTRLRLCNEARTKITNYGMVLAYLTGTLDRSIKIFSTLK